MALPSIQSLETQRKRVFITVKAYPLPSRSYTELVCTAGLLEDGTWIRIYPVPFRFLEDKSKYQKYQWIDIDLIRNTEDFRPESYRPANPDLSDIEIVQVVGTGIHRDWKVSREYCCKEVYTNLTTLIEDSKKPKLKSLATFKPTRILGFKVEEDEPEWKDQWLALRKQGDLFVDKNSKDLSPVRKLPYKFKYRIIDNEGRKSTMMIEDWEIGALYWNCLAHAEGNEADAIAKVRQRYFDEFITKDIHLFLGTTKQYHGYAKNPFVIIGVFYPPVCNQTDLFYQA